MIATKRAINCAVEYGRILSRHHFLFNITKFYSYTLENGFYNKKIIRKT